MDYHSGTVLYRNIKCCDEDKLSSTVDFKKAYPKEFDASAPTSYSKKTKNYTNSCYETTAQKLIKDETNTAINGNDPYIFKSKCYQYEALLQRIRSLLEEIRAIRNNEATGMCEFCKRYNTTGKCKRCEILSNRFGIRPVKEKEARQQRFKIWLFKVKQFLYMILEREVCKHKLYHGDSSEADELKNLLHQLKSPLNVRQPYIGHFPSDDSLENISESKDILEEVLFKLKTEKLYPSLTSGEDLNYTSNVGEVPYTLATAGDYFNLATKGRHCFHHSITAGKISFDFSPADNNSYHPHIATGASNYPARVTRSPIKASTNASRVSCPTTCKYFDGKKQAIHSDEEKKIFTQKYNQKQSTGKNAEEKEELSDKTGKSRLVSKGEAKGKTQKSNKLRQNEGNSQSNAEKSEALRKVTDSNIKGSKKGAQESSSVLTKSNVCSQAAQNNKRKKDTDEKPKPNSEDELMAMLMKSAGKREEKGQKESKKPEKPLQLPKIEELPVVQRKTPKVIEKIVSESVIECDLKHDEPTEMIKGKKIIPIEPRGVPNTGSVRPMLFKIKAEIVNGETQETGSTLTTPGTIKSRKIKSKTELGQNSGKGRVKYALSNREFIDKGWTLLPTTKIMRRMNIYKMLPANPKSDWFEKHKSRGVMFYDSGEKLAEIKEDGSGKWYYKNGMLALEYYSSEETNSGHRYVVYSSGENDAGGRKLPVTVLASFDYLGNGVVYDHYGNERIKYNQSEGVVIDKKIGPPGRWKWHTLNEPPVLQPVFVDTHVKSDSCIQKLLQARKDDDKSNDGSKHIKEPNFDMLAIELENFMKEKANKLLQEFKPFHIKMKACKVNDQFSLKVLDQSNVYLLFREGQISIKLNLGMLLISNEIVDTDTAEVTQVATPYDRHPPKSQSIANIQNVLEKARKLGKFRRKSRD